MECPDEGILLSYAAGELDGAELDRLDEHIDRCRACAELVALAAREPEAPAAQAGWSSDTGTRWGGKSSASTGRADEMPYEIGRYVVLGRLGQGGMGTVYAAYDPRLERHVAIKLLRRDRAIDARRLRVEARSLASLAHPNVVGVFEIGSFDATGSMFLVMELVDGVTLRKWCRAPERRPAEILSAYLGAGRGLAAAHAAGLVHRDFKPDNVLVGRDGSVRVTDFGLARPSGCPTPSESLDGAWSSVVLAHVEHLTETGTVTGTPAYMAPEQREGNEVDARADQFAFCVSLWEALSGTRPHASTMSAVVMPVPPHVRRALRRGLDPDPLHRWPDMNALLRELGRVPVRPLRVAIGGALGTCAVAAMAWLAWPVTAPDEAFAPMAGMTSAADPDSALSAAARAQVDAVRADLRRVRPLREATDLDEALRLSAELLVEARAIDHPPLVAAVAVERGWTLYEVSRFEEASTLLAEAHEIAWAHGLDELAAESASVLAAMSEHLDDVEGGLAWARRAESAIERLPPGERDEAMSLLASARAHLWESAGRPDEALASAELALELIERNRSDDDPLLSNKHRALGSTLSDIDPEAALSHYARALAIAREAYGDDHPDVALVLLDIGALHEVRGDAEVALPYTEQALAILEAAYGPEHHLVATALYNLGVVQEELGDKLAAVALFKRAAAIWEATLGPNHRRVALPITLLAYISFDAGDLADAEEHYQRALVLYEEGLGPEHSECTTPLSGLAEIAILQGRGERAVAFAERALAIATAIDEPPADLAGRRFRLARALDVAGREDASTRLAAHALADLRKSGDPAEAEEVERWLADREASQ